MIVEVVFPIALARSFDYQLPEKLKKGYWEQKSIIGFRVFAPWRNSHKEGIIVACKKQSKVQKLKTIHSLCDDFPITSLAWIVFSQWVANYYFASWGELVFFAIPSSIRLQKSKNKGVLFTNPLVEKTTQEVYFFVENYGKKFKANSKKQKLLDFFLYKKKATKEQILLQIPSSYKAIVELSKLGILEKKKEKIKPITQTSTSFSLPKLNYAQQQIAQQCKIEKNFHIYLLHGANASGKTEIYIFLIGQALQQKKSVLFLVPEIALTPQTEKRIQGYFPEKVLVWHSSLNQSAKFKVWLQMKNSDAYILLGTRSALFQPIKNLGFIVIDEEHDASFRQIENPSYNARDAACKLAQLQNIPIMLGSATPSIESYHNTKLGKYSLLFLKERYQNKQTPEIELVDLKTAPKYNEIYYFSHQLQKEIAKNLAKKEQTMLFHHRRGFASFVTCKFCQQVLECPHCSVAATWHDNQKKLLCHYCLWEHKDSFVCQKCNSKQFFLQGIGVEKIARLLRSVFPSARILRMDSDSSSNTKELQKNLKLIENFEVDIIIGTQIITKGHHFPKVTLCAVLLADAGFQRLDYRATERTFQALSQFIGRSGRAGETTGKVVIQSLAANSQLLQYVIKQDFIAFYHYEIEKRKILQQPPSHHWIVIRISSKIENNSQKYAKKLFSYWMEKKWKQVQLLGIIPATPYKLGDWYRLEIILQSKSIRILQKILQKEPLEKFSFASTKIKIIVNP